MKPDSGNLELLEKASEITLNALGYYKQDKEQAGDSQEG